MPQVGPFVGLGKKRKKKSREKVEKKKSPTATGQKVEKKSPTDGPTNRPTDGCTYMSVHVHYNFEKLWERTSN